ncbi:MATH and LRR domain-containing protein PFE0570w-like [Homarus americanus]|uniref:MATH and LRR domain-containing protein PFE0570w-like n=1 Tax=Homarus americanus TaxID=6706 RepID=UPI001C450BAF|nr:MATH and LRR domain-containing protein PFE0570w-like [Homarus americanus]
MLFDNDNLIITKDTKKNKKKSKRTLNEHQDNGQALNTMSELAENTLKKKKKKRKINSFDNERIENNDSSMFHLENEQSGSFELEFTESLDVHVRKNKSKKRKRTIFPGTGGQVCHDASCHDDDMKPKKQKLGPSLSLENELDNPDFGNKIKYKKAKGSWSLSDVDVKAGIDVDVTMDVDTTKHDVTHSFKKCKKSKNILEVSCTEEKNTAQASDDRDAEDTTHTLIFTSQFDDNDNTINNNNKKKKSKKKVKQDLDSSLDAHGWDTTHSIDGQNDDKDKIIKKKSKKKVKQDLDSSLDAHGWDTTHSIDGQNDDKDKIIKKKSKKKEKQDLDSSLDAHGWDTTHSINGQNDDKDKIIKKKSKKKEKTRS